MALHSQENFICTVTNTLNWTYRIIYQPNIAYGPDFVDLMILNPDKDMCDKTSIAIGGSCLVSDSNPFPIVNIHVNNLSIQLNPGTEKNKYVFNLPFPTTGTFNVSCLAKNSIFGDLPYQTMESVHITGSPTVLQIYSIINNEIITASSNTLFVYQGISAVFCESEGEFSYTKYMSLICGNLTHYDTNKDTVFLILNISKAIGQINCSCDVWSESNCTKKTVSVLIKVITHQNKEESNGVAIGLGVTAGIALILLFAITFVFIFWRRKHKRTDDTIVGKKSEDYSDLQEKKDNYELPNLPKCNSSEDEISSAFDIQIKQKTHGQRSPNNELGGFIITDDLEVDKNRTNLQDKKHYAVKLDEHQYDEVTEIIEHTLTNKKIPGYSNVNVLKES